MRRASWRVFLGVHSHDALVRWTVGRRVRVDSRSVQRAMTDFMHECESILMDNVEMIEEQRVLQKALRAAESRKRRLRQVRPHSRLRAFAPAVAPQRAESRGFWPFARPTPPLLSTARGLTQPLFPVPASQHRSCWTCSVRGCRWQQSCKRPRRSTGCRNSIARTRMRHIRCCATSMRGTHPPSNRPRSSKPSHTKVFARLWTRACIHTRTFKRQTTRSKGF